MFGKSRIKTGEAFGSVVKESFYNFGTDLREKLGADANWIAILISTVSRHEAGLSIETLRVPRMILFASYSPSSVILHSVHSFGSFRCLMLLPIIILCFYCSDCVESFTTTR